MAFSKHFKSTKKASEEPIPVCIASSPSTPANDEDLRKHIDAVGMSMQVAMWECEAQVKAMSPDGNVPQVQVQFAGPSGHPDLSGPQKSGEKMEFDDYIKLYQKQLVFLIHAHECQKRNLRRCTKPFCKAMKKLLSHMNRCVKGRTCDTHHCFSSSLMVSHWIHCDKADCSICVPLKQADTDNLLFLNQ